MFALRQSGQQSNAMQMHQREELWAGPTELAAAFSQEFYAQQPDFGNKHPKRVIDLLVSLDASRELHSANQVIAGRSPNENSVMAFTIC
jgi:hypothetical protein